MITSKHELTIKRQFFDYFYSQIITDNQLFVMVFVFFLIDIVILTAWQIFDPMFVQIIDLYERVRSLILLRHKLNDSVSVTEIRTHNYERNCDG